MIDIQRSWFPQIMSNPEYSSTLHILHNYIFTVLDIANSAK